MFGVLIDGHTPFAVTLERKWNNNIRNISCIPPGSYVCKRIESPKFGNTFEVTNVVGRKHILFHWGNLYLDSHGCIIVGEEFGELRENIAVLSSRRGFREFIKRTDGIDAFMLKITEHLT